MARASTPTILSLDRYAKIMGIPPMHFNGAYVDVGTADIFPLEGCESIWFQYDWQNHDQVSREQLAMVIHEAEEELARVVGYYPGPVWIASEEHRYPRPYPPDVYGYTGADVRGMYKGISTDYGKVISTGRRKVTLLATPAITYWDIDADGFFELGVANLTTTLTDPCVVKAFFANHHGDPQWEIEPKSAVLSGGVMSFGFESWKLITPSLFEAYPTSNGMQGVDISTTNNFVTTIELYQETTDPTLSAAEFVWEPYSTPCPTCSGVGCDSCAEVNQDGCAGIRDAVAGIIVPTPAEYNADTANWDGVVWEDCREPDQVRLWYYSGERDQQYLQGFTCDPLSHFWAETIAYLATTRLERPVCACGNIAGCSRLT